MFARQENIALRIDQNFRVNIPGGTVGRRGVPPRDFFRRAKRVDAIGGDGLTVIRRRNRLVGDRSRYRRLVMRL